MAVGIHAARYHRSLSAHRASLSMRFAPARYHNAADIVDISRVRCRAFAVGVHVMFMKCAQSATYE